MYLKRKEQGFAFEKIGRCYLKLKEYPLALYAFKMQLKIGWISDDKTMELMAYDNMGMAYYYMGDLEGAQYYHERMINGVIEENNSICKINCVDGEDKLRKKVIQDRESCNPQRIYNISGYLPFLASTAEEKAKLLYAEYKIGTKKNDTPKFALDNPVQVVNAIDLPSPRKSKIMSSISGGNRDNIADFNKNEKKVEKGHKNSLMLFRLKQNKRSILAKLARFTSAKVR